MKGCSFDFTSLTRICPSFWLSSSNPYSCLDVGSTSYPLLHPPTAPAPSVKVSQEIIRLPVCVLLLYQCKTYMAATLSWCCSRAFEPCSQFSYFVVWFAVLASASATTVTQEPLFASFLQGQKLSFSCSHSTTSSYDFYWYRQLPGKTELQHLGTLQYFTDTWTEEFSHEPKNWLEAKWLGVGKKEMILHLENLQAGDTGLYLCAARDTVREARTGAGTKQSPRKEGTTSADNSASIINTQSHSVEPVGLTLLKI
ncbi:uncharacterized protein LOC103278904 [Anolis carolinensis]|uniref:uncharacterized protein LOC103278904 n=1 Tax=Anolis carolinensis TaxID=28377 RepID=UPI0007DB72A4|nr:PREDICTED: uncharacterized protein LOC103278904 [Anolis carolinensis]|eukprot:XP_016849905.1 PREDICTED: uncharacterized protein LOC103278904 [Anolis carolinensis]